MEGIVDLQVHRKVVGILQFNFTSSPSLLVVPELKQSVEEGRVRLGRVTLRFRFQAN